MEKFGENFQLFVGKLLVFVSSNRVRFFGAVTAALVFLGYLGLPGDVQVGVAEQLAKTTDAGVEMAIAVGAFMKEVVVLAGWLAMGYATLKSLIARPATMRDHLSK